MCDCLPERRQWLNWKINIWDRLLESCSIKNLIFKHSLKFITGPLFLSLSCSLSPFEPSNFLLLRLPSNFESAVKRAQLEKGGHKTPLGVSMLFNCTTWKSASGFQFRLKLHKISFLNSLSASSQQKLFRLFVPLPINLARERVKKFAQ